MRMTDKIANEKFNGNIEDAIRYILWNYKNKELDPFVFEWNKEESQIAYNLIVNKAKENEKKVEKNEKVLESLNLTKEEVLNAKKNPYKVKLAKQILTLIIVNGGLISLASILQNSNPQISTGVLEAMAKYIPSIFTTYMALDIGPNFLNYFKFKKLKKQYEKENNHVQNETFEGKVL